MLELIVNLNKRLDKFTYGDEECNICFYRKHFTYKNKLTTYFFKYDRITYINRYHFSYIEIHTPDAIILIKNKDIFSDEFRKLFDSFLTRLISAFEYNDAPVEREWI